jgi:hypothetical protein
MIAVNSKVNRARKRVKTHGDNGTRTGKNHGHGKAGRAGEAGTVRLIRFLVALAGGDPRQCQFTAVETALAG